MFPTTTTSLALAIEIAAVIVSALSGMIAASQQKLDIVGAATLALVTAFGGGTVRDLLIDRRPFFWMARWEYVPLIIGMTVAFVYSTRAHKVARAIHDRAVLVDAFGLALFSLTGVSYAVQAGSPTFVAVLIGVLTGAGGGVLRDVLVHETPMIFRPGSGLYALAAFAGGWASIGAAAASGSQALGATIGFVTIVALRLLSAQYGLLKVPVPLWMRDRPEK